jgi:hypothetical protein
MIQRRRNADASSVIIARKLPTNHMFRDSISRAVFVMETIPVRRK